MSKKLKEVLKTADLTDKLKKTNMDGAIRIFQYSSEPKPSKLGIEGDIWSDPKSNKKIWNAYEKINGELYRQRAEVLVFNKEGQILLSDNKPGYKIPGGSTEPTISVKDTVIKEAKEESFINIKNVKYSNIRYTVDFEDYWVDKYEKLLSIRFKGFNVFLYYADYDSVFKGNVETHDLDKELKEAKWFNIEDVKDILREPHLKLIKQLRK